MTSGLRQSLAGRAVVIAIAALVVATGTVLAHPVISVAPAPAAAAEPASSCPAGQVPTWIGSELICAGPLSVDDGPDAILHRGALREGLHAATELQMKALARMSQQAIEITAAAHGVPDDLAAVRTWGRADAQAELWSLIVQAIQTPKADRTDDQVLVVSWMEDMVRRQGVEVARQAGAELTVYTGLSLDAYNALFAGGAEPTKQQLETFLAVEPLNYNNADTTRATAGYCVYRAPAPYGAEYTGFNDLTCFTPCPVVGTCDDPMPSYESFMKWGAARYRGQAVQGQFAGASRTIAIGVALGGSTAALVTGALFASTLGTTLANTAFVSSIFPYASSVTVQSVARGFSAPTVGTSGALTQTPSSIAAGGQVGAAAAGFIAGTVIVFLVGVTIRSIFLFEDLAVPGKVAQAIVDARTATNDLGAMLGRQEDAFTLWSLFVGATLPEPRTDTCNNAPLLTGVRQLCLNAPPIPPAAAGDPAFLVRTWDPAGDGVTDIALLSEAVRPEITFASSLAAGKYFTTARLHGPWFVQRLFDYEVQGFRIRYIDWEDRDQTAWLVRSASGGHEFFGIPEGVCAEDVEVGGTCLGPVVDPVSCIVNGTCWRSDRIRYRGASGTYETAQVLQAVPVTWAAPQPIQYGTPLTSAILDASAAIPGTFAYTVDGQPVSASDGLVLDAGTHTLGVTFTPTDPLQAPGGARVTLTVTRAPLRLVAVSPTMRYGASVPTITSSWDGFVNGDDAADTANSQGTLPTVTCSTSATSTSPVGSYPTTCSVLYLGPARDFDDFQPRNYAITPVAGVLRVTPATLTVAASSPTMVYGDTVPAIQPVYRGFVPGDTASVVAVAPTCTVDATARSIVGQYQTTCSGGSVPNYTITHVPGSLTINRRTLAITATGRTKTYGDVVAFAGTEFTAEGLVNDDTVERVTLTSAGADAMAPVPDRPYPIVPSLPVGTGLSNYLIVFVDGSLTVTPKALRVKADDRDKTYGETVTFEGTEVTVEGLVNDDTVSGATLTSDGADETAGVSGSPWSIVASDAVGSGLGNYAITYLAGSLRVEPAPLTVTASSHTVVIGAPIPAITPRYAGFVAGDTAADLVAAPACSTTAGASSPIGSYPSACAGAQSPDYRVSNVGGLVTITNGTVALFDQARARKTGSSVPIRVRTLDARGTNTSTPSLSVVLATPALSPAPGTRPQPAGAFRFVLDRSGGFYQYDLKTTGYPPGRYTLSWRVQGDPVTHQVSFVLVR